LAGQVLDTARYQPTDISTGPVTADGPGPGEAVGPTPSGDNRLDVQETPHCCQFCPDVTVGNAVVLAAQILLKASASPSIATFTKG